MYSLASALRLPVAALWMCLCFFRGQLKYVYLSPSIAEPLRGRSRGWLQEWSSGYFFRVQHRRESISGIDII